MKNLSAPAETRAELHHYASITVSTWQWYKVPSSTPLQNSFDSYVCFSQTLQLGELNTDLKNATQMPIMRHLTDLIELFRILSLKMNKMRGNISK
jgi:hypothetical protein